LPCCKSCCYPWTILERVQHRFTRLFSELRSLPYEVRLCQLGLWSLEGRRNRTDLIEVFKLVKGFSRRLLHGMIFFTNRIMLLPEVIFGNWRRITATATPVFSSSLSVSSTVGIVCLRRILKSHQWTRSKDAWNDGIAIRWTSLKTTSQQVLPAARLPTDIDAELTLRRIKGGCSCTWWVTWWVTWNEITYFFVSTIVSTKMAHMTSSMRAHEKSVWRWKFSL